MRLLGYKVTNFRSVSDSGWIEADTVTSLIGVNESGKTNLLIPLWKLNPAHEGEIHPTSDYPKRIFGEIREDPGNYCFITAKFSIDGEILSRISNLTKIQPEALNEVSVSRYFDGNHSITFPKYQPPSSNLKEVAHIFSEAADQINELTALKTEENFKSSLIKLLRDLEISFTQSNERPVDAIFTAINSLRAQTPENPPKTSTINPRLLQTVEALEILHAKEIAPAPEEVAEIEASILGALPKFVYYSNYGNLDSEIYLPHVVQNLARKDLGTKEADKARTLRVLFQFVRLKPEEILALGKDFQDPNRQPSAEEIETISEKKRERAILLQSAGTELTTKFREWWKQGDYRFRFDADGDHFRIWVADDRRPEEIELESRSTGLQWFLSFYLVFLVESLGGAHESAILLLDEPGLSLHPLAQRDLAHFFDSLSRSNQLVFTTHSPFLVDADRLDRVRKVYVDDDGTTKSSPDLRQSTAKKAQAGAAYAVYSALNLNISESLLLGCLPVVVEGTADQHYLTTIKSLLISGKKISPTREIVFPPGGGTKTLRITASILTGRDDQLPITLLDGDVMGRKMISELSSSLYTSEKEKILCTDDFVGFENSEVEDLFPTDEIADAVDRVTRSAETPFREFVKQGSPIVPQIENWAKEQELILEQGWKVEVSKRVKQTLLRKGFSSIDASTIEKWSDLFNRILPSDSIEDKKI